VKVLILQVRRLGDVLMTTPMLRALKAAIPGVTTHICVERSSLPAVRTNPNLDQAILSPGGASIRLVPVLRRQRYDVVIDTLGSPASARLAFLSGAPVRIGPDRPWRRPFYTHPCPIREGTYSALAKLTRLAPLGVRSSDARIEVFPTHEDEREAASLWDGFGLDARARVVAFSPVSRRAAKVWPPDRFAAVCDAWAERAGLLFLPLFGPGEGLMVDAVLRSSRCREAYLYPCAPVSFGALAPLITRCAFYFGNDNGIRHVAIAAGIPTAAVFAHPDPATWTPPDSPEHVYVGGRTRADRVTIDEADSMVATLANALGLGRGLSW
jgi:ADP-heptose:LPS heptosyltransferase